MLNFIDKLITFLFAQDKKKHTIPQEREQQLLALWLDESEEE